MTDRHYNPLLITVLPKERRARHSYQLAAMGMLFTLGLWQGVIGAAPTSPVSQLDENAYRLLNLICVVGGAAGIASAIIPERIIRICVKRPCFDFDATYARLWVEFGAHISLFTAWMAFGLTVWASYGLAKGYSFGLAAALWFGGAALWRAGQIMWTLIKAGTFRRPASAIVSSTGLDSE